MTTNDEKNKLHGIVTIDGEEYAGPEYIEEAYKINKENLKKRRQRGVYKKSVRLNKTFILYSIKEIEEYENRNT